MNRWRLMRHHYRLYRNPEGRKAIWAGIWFFQILDMFGYYTAVSGIGMQRVILYPLLALVFVYGNADSTRNRPFLQSRPLPAGTPFWTDAMLPFAAYSLIPLLREIPLVIFYQLGFSTLLWAWADFLFLHVLFFIAAWSLGALLPRINHPLKAGIALLSTGIVFAALTLWIQQGDTPTSPDIFWGGGQPLDIRYSLLAACNLVVILICAIGLRFHIRGRAAVGMVYVLLLPLCTLLIWRLPDPLQAGWIMLDRFNGPPPIPKSDFQVHTPSYWLNSGISSDFRQKEITHVLRLVPESSIVPVDHLYFSVNGFRIVTENQTRFEPEIFFQPFPAAFDLQLLEDRYGPLSPEQIRKARSHYSFYENDTMAVLRKHRFPDWKGGPVEMDVFLTLHELGHTPLTMNQPLGDWSVRSTGPTGLIRLLGAERSLKPYPHYQIQRRVFLDFREEHLFWKRLCIGPPPPFRILAVFRNREDRLDQEYITKEFRTFARWGSGPFPRSGTRDLLGWDSYDREDHLLGEKEAVRDPETLEVDVFLIAPAKTWSTQTTDYARLPGYASKSRGQWFEQVDDQPLGTWETEALASLPGTSAQRYSQGKQLGRNLASLPPTSYRSVLFRAALLDPEYGNLLIQNGWEKEATAIWLDLARQEIRLPDPVLFSMVRMEDPRIRQALLHYQSWNPDPKLLAATQTDPAFHRQMLEATRQAHTRLKHDDSGMTASNDLQSMQHRSAWVWIGEAPDGNVSLSEYYPLPYPDAAENVNETDTANSVNGQNAKGEAR